MPLALSAIKGLTALAARVTWFARVTAAIVVTIADAVIAVAAEYNDGNYN